MSGDGFVPPAQVKGFFSSEHAPLATKLDGILEGAHFFVPTVPKSINFKVLVSFEMITSCPQKEDCWWIFLSVMAKTAPQEGRWGFDLLHSVESQASWHGTIYLTLYHQIVHPFRKIFLILLPRGILFKSIQWCHICRSRLHQDHYIRDQLDLFFKSPYSYCMQVSHFNWSPNWRRSSQGKGKSWAIQLDMTRSSSYN